MLPLLAIHVYSGESLAASAGQTTLGVVTPVQIQTVQVFAAFAPLQVHLTVQSTMENPFSASCGLSLLEVHPKVFGLLNRPLCL